MKNMINGLLILTIIVFASCGRGDNSADNSDAKTQQNPGLQSDTRIKNAMTFINGYVENANKLNKSIDDAVWVSSNMLSTKSFKKEMKRLIKEGLKENPELGLEADPVFDAQDYPHKGFEPESFDENTGYLTVRGIGWPDFRLTMKIVNEQGIWLVEGCGMINVPEDKRAAR